MAAPHRIVRAWLESPTVGVIELDRDWPSRGHPRFSLGKHCPIPQAIAPAPVLLAGRSYGYTVNRSNGSLLFVLPLEHGCDINPSRDKVYLAGDFNGWEAAVGQDAWQLKPMDLEGERILVWRGEAAGFP